MLHLKIPCAAAKMEDPTGRNWDGAAKYINGYFKNKLIKGPCQTNMHTANTFAECLAYGRALYVCCYYSHLHHLYQTTLWHKPLLWHFAQPSGDYLRVSIWLIREGPQHVSQRSGKTVHSYFSLSHKGHFVFQKGGLPSEGQHTAPWLCLFTGPLRVHFVNKCVALTTLTQMDVEEPRANVPEISNVLPIKRPGPEAHLLSRQMHLFLLLSCRPSPAVQNKGKEKHLFTSLCPVCDLSQSAKTNQVMKPDRCTPKISFTNFNISVQIVCEKLCCEFPISVTICLCYQ